MRFVSLVEIIGLHFRVRESGGGGAGGIRDLGALESAVSQPHAKFSGADLYPTLFRKAAALGHSLVCNHPFVDGNKRVGHAALEVMLILNGYEIVCSADEQEELFLNLAKGEVSRDQLAEWVSRVAVQRNREAHGEIGLS